MSLGRDEMQDDGSHDARTAMIAPLRLSGNKPRVSIARTASMAILIKVQTMSRFLPLQSWDFPFRYNDASHAINDLYPFEQGL